MEYLFAGEGKTIFGGRAPQKLMEGLQRVSAQPKMSMDMINGALDAANNSADNRIRTTVAGQFGGRYPKYLERQQGGSAQTAKGPADLKSMSTDDLFNQLAAK
jgi:hypothetical protein